MLQFTMRSSDVWSVAISNITLKAHGTGNDSAAIAEILWFNDTDGDGVYDAATDPLINSSRYELDDGTATLSQEPAVYIPTGSTRHYLVLYRMTGNPENVTFGDTFQFTMPHIHVTYSTVVPQPPPMLFLEVMDSAVKTVVGVECAVGPRSPADHDFVPHPMEAKEDVMLQFALEPYYNSVSVRNLTLTANGSGDDAAAVMKVMLIADSDGDGQIDDGEPVLDTARFDTDNGTLSMAFAQNLTAGTAFTFILAYQLASSVTAGETFQFSLDAIGAVGHGTGEAVYTAGLPLLSACTTVRSGVIVHRGDADRGDHSWRYDPTAPRYDAMLQLEVTAAVTAAEVETVVCSANGTGNDPLLVDSVYCVEDIDGDGVYDEGSDHLIDSATWDVDDGNVHFSLQPALGAIPREGNVSLLFVYLMNASATEPATLKLALHSVEGVTADGDAEPLTMVYEPSLGSLGNTMEILASHPPDVDLVRPEDGVTLSGPKVINITVTDPDGVELVEAPLIELRASGGDWSTLGHAHSVEAPNGSIRAQYYLNWSTPAFDDGTYQLRVVATDDQNWTVRSEIATVTINNSVYNRPVVALVTPTGGATLSGIVWLEANVTDNNDNLDAEGVRFYHSTDGENWTFIGNSSTPIGGEEHRYRVAWNTSTVANRGGYWLMANASDTTGLYAADMIGEAVAVNNIPLNAPEIAILYPYTGLTLRGTITVRAEVTDPEDNVNLTTLRLSYYSSVGDTWVRIAAPYQQNGSVFAWSWDTTAPEEGDQYRLRVMVSDTTGIEAENTTGPFTISQTAPNNPVVTLLYPRGGEELAGTITLRARITDPGDNIDADGARFFISDKGSEWEAVGNDPNPNGTIFELSFNTSQYEDGAGYRFRARAIDTTGLFGQDVTLSPCTIHNSLRNAPVVELGPIDDPVEGTVTLSATVFDLEDNVERVQFSFSRDGVNWTAIDNGTAIGEEGGYRLLWDTTSLQNGPGYYLSVTATDSTSLVSQRVVSASFTISNPQPPTLELLAPTAGTTLSGETTLLVRASDPDGDIVASSLVWTYSSDNTSWTRIGVASASSAAEDRYQLDWDTTDVPNGEYYLNISVEDRTGHTVYNRTAFRVQIDNPDRGEPVDDAFFSLSNPIFLLILIGAIVGAVVLIMVVVKRREKRARDEAAAELEARTVEVPKVPEVADIPGVERMGEGGEGEEVIPDLFSEPSADTAGDATRAAATDVEVDADVDADVDVDVDVDVSAPERAPTPAPTPELAPEIEPEPKPTSPSPSPSPAPAPAPAATQSVMRVGSKKRAMREHPTLTTASASHKCGVCFGVVKTGLDIVKCICGKHYHASCAHRIQECPGCGTTIDPDALAGAEGGVDKAAPAEKVDTTPTEQEVGFTLSTATESVKCGICFGVVKTGLTLLKCKCGKNYHEACAKRMGHCPYCERPVTAELIETARAGMEKGGTKPGQGGGVETVSEEPPKDEVGLVDEELDEWFSDL